MARPHPFLLAVARGDVPQEPIDAGVVESAVEHRLAGSLHRMVSEGAADADRHATRALAVHHLNQSHRRTLLLRAMGLLADRLHAADVQWLTFKGLAAEHLYYEMDAERPAADIDVLLSPDSVVRAAAAIRAIEPEHPTPDLIEEAVLRHVLQHVDLRLGPVPVDLHFDFFKIGLPTINHQLIWDRSTQIDLDGVAGVRTVCPEISLVGMVLHQNKDAFSLLGPMVEVQKALTTSKVDWEFIRALVTAEGLAVPFWLGLDRIAAYTGIENVPAAPRLNDSRSKLWRAIWPTSSALSGAPGRATAPNRQLLMPLTVSGRTRATVRELRRQAIPERRLFEVMERRSLAGTEYLRRLTLDRVRRLREARESSIR